MQLETKQLIRFLCARSLIAQKASYWFSYPYLQFASGDQFVYHDIVARNMHVRVLAHTHGLIHTLLLVGCL